MSKEIDIQRREFRDYAVGKIQPALQGIVSPGIDAARAAFEAAKASAS